MIRLRHNWLLWQVVVIYAIFIVIGSFVPKPYISSGTAIMALAAGALMMSRYAGKAIDILLRGERGSYGAHNAILGAFEMAVGIVYSGMFRLLWVYFDRPATWSSTVWSSLGLFMIAKGVYRLAVSPDETIPGQRFPEGFKMVILWTFGIVVAFIAGTHFSDIGQ